MQAEYLQLRLPDLFAVCPFKGSTNPHYAEVRRESSDWVVKHSAVTGKQLQHILMGNVELLASYMYPLADRDRFRTCCDFINLLYAIDEISDVQSSEDARKTGFVCLNAMKDDKWDDGSALAKMSKEFRGRFLQLGSELCLRRLLKEFEDYTDAVVKEAAYRECNQIPDMETYVPLRRRGSAVFACFALIEYAMGEDLPDEVFEDPHFMSMYNAACDMVCWSNDIYSYKMESDRGIHCVNVVSVLMKEKNLSIQEASDHIGVYYKKLIDDFLQDKCNLPSWGPHVDKIVKCYVRGMEDSAIASLEFSFASKRYLGADRDEIRKTLILPLTKVL
ncbi:terpenoid synthase [Neolentinus lepideus HHB14362 ss-1]|uniref:Terpene synthase n=1 Tax=Neolentinus lepideus HHB14362 ss-1 TaxID=1314782 RepID=A0A165UIB5_9AGAM|nr:terpenoid synthase [Neolentinus lepideus HHB14362 ss-1]